MSEDDERAESLALLRELAADENLGLSAAAAGFLRDYLAREAAKPPPASACKECGLAYSHQPFWGVTRDVDGRVCLVCKACVERAHGGA